MGGLTSPKGGNTVQTTKTESVPPYVQSAQQNLLNASKTVTAPYIQQQGFTSAPINADQSAAYDLTRSVAQGAFNGGKSFNGAAYLQANPDVAAAKMDPYEHYQKYGQAEGRALVAPANLIDYRTQAGLTAGPAVQATSQGYTPSTYAASTYNPSTYASQGYTAKGYDPASYTGAQYTSQGYTAKGYDPSTYKASTYEGQGYKAVMSQAAQVTGGEIQKLLNPYTQSVVDTTLDTMRRQYDETGAANRLRSAAAGSFGGSRQAIQQSQLDRSYGDQVASTTATLMAAGYDKATATALSNAGFRQQTGLANQTATNNAAEFTAGAKNAANAANAAALNSAGQFNATAKNQAGSFLAGAQNDAARYGAEAANAASQYNATSQNTANQFNATSRNQAGSFLAGAQNSAAQYGAEAANAAAQYGATAKNSAGQYNATAQNTAAQNNQAAQNAAAQYGATAANNTSQFNATAQNSRDQYNSTLLATLLQNQNANALTQRGQDIGLLSTQSSLQSAEQTRQLQAIQALLGIGDAQRGIYQGALDQPLKYLSALAGTTPTNYGGTATATSPNTAPSPLQSIIGGLGTLATSTIPGGSLLGGLLKG